MLNKTVLIDTRYLNMNHVIVYNVWLAEVLKMAAI